jgi:hypothetical protein
VTGTDRDGRARRRGAIAGLAFAAACAGAACSSARQSEFIGEPVAAGGALGADAASDDASPGAADAPLDAGSAWSPWCPEEAPEIDASCVTALGWSQSCEYAYTWWSVSCAHVVVCQQGAWQASPQTFGPCTPEPPPNASACPDSAALVKGPCAEAGVTCDYLQGISCACADDGEGGTAWSCLPELGCPITRPRLGAPCGAPDAATAYGGQQCTYERCGLAVVCANGAWQPTIPPCP